MLMMMKGRRMKNELGRKFVRLDDVTALQGAITSREVNREVMLPSSPRRIDETSRFPSSYLPS